MTDPSARYGRSTSILARTVGPEILLGTCYAEDFRVLFGTARTIWVWLDEPRTAQELAAMAAQLYGMPASAVIGDIDRLLQTLEEAGLVERVA